MICNRLITTVRDFKMKQKTVHMESRSAFGKTFLKFIVGVSFTGPYSIIFSWHSVYIHIFLVALAFSIFLILLLLKYSVFENQVDF